MYKVYCDDYLIHNHNLNDLKLISPKLSVELNKLGSFDFQVPQVHPYYSIFKKLKSTVKVLRNDKIIFYGRVLDTNRGFYNTKNVICEGTLSFFRTTTQRPYDYSGSVRGFLTFLIDNHNADADDNRKIYLGNIEIEDDNEYITRSNSNYSSTYDCLMDKCIALLGGFFHFRYVDDVIYMDYIKNYVKINSQKIEATKNLKSFDEYESAEDVITVLIPLGAYLTDEDGNETDERLTIKSVNNGLDYIVNEDSIAIYGKNYGTEIWEDVTEASNLFTKGEAFLLEAINFSRTLEIGAADLSNIDTTIESYEIGDYVTVYSVPHSVDYQMLCTKLDLNLNQPSSDVLNLGTTISTLTETLLQSTSQNANIIEIVNKINKDYVTNQTVTDKITATQEEIEAEIAYNVAQIESEQANLQNQIDGVVEYWTGSDVPTLSNYPASEWLTDDEKYQHIGDTYTNYQNLTPSVTDTIVQFDDGINGTNAIVTSAVDCVITRCGKNFINLKTENLASYGLNGVINSDGSLTVSGTPTSAYACVYSEYIYLPNGSYCMAQQKVENMIIQFAITYTDGTITYMTSAYARTFDINNDNISTIRLTIQMSNSTDEVINAVLYPQLELGTTSSEFECYAGNTYTIYQNTSTSIPLLDGTNTFFSDSDAEITVDYKSMLAGGTYRFEYNNEYEVYQWALIADSDITKVYQELATTQAAIDGKVAFYYSQPTSYSMGDVWILSEDTTINDITYPAGTYLNALETSSYFDETHWTELAKYTDDTGLNELKSVVEINTSNIEQTSSSILLEVARIYATNDVLESLESTLISQTSESIEFVKTTLTDNIVNLTGTVTSNQQLIEEYIRFDGAEISLGTSDSDFTAVLDNEKLAFQENGQNVAYISNQKMNISDAEIENSLKIGNFKWQPRDNGNLSLVYIG